MCISIYIYIIYIEYHIDFIHIGSILSQFIHINTSHESCSQLEFSMLQHLLRGRVRSEPPLQYHCHGGSGTHPIPSWSQLWGAHPRHANGSLRLLNCSQVAKSCKFVHVRKYLFIFIFIFISIVSISSTFLRCVFIRV